MVLYIYTYKHIYSYIMTCAYISIHTNTNLIYINMKKDNITSDELSYCLMILDQFSFKNTIKGTRTMAIK